MSSLSELAMARMLRSPEPRGARTVKFFNTFPASVDLFRVDTLGRRYLVAELPYEDKAGTAVQAFDGERFGVNSVHTGGFMMAVEIKGGQNDYRLTSYELRAPYDIGPVPTPTKQVPIPVDSTRTVTGMGLHSVDTFIIREQYWSRLSESYMLAPLEKKTVSYTTSSGMQQTSSEQSTVEKSLSVGVSAGWGPISASVNASLNESSTTSHQVTITEERTTFLSDTVENQRDKPVMYLRWQLTDVISIYSSSVPQGASVVLGENPVLIFGPYILDDLPAEPVFEDDYAALSSERRTALEDALIDGLTRVAAVNRAGWHR
jgi:hypothetical protein